MNTDSSERPATAPPRSPRMWRKLWELMLPEQRHGAIAILALLLVGTVLETLGIGLVIPALTVLVQADFAARHPTVVSLLGLAAGAGPRAVLTRGLLVLVAVYLVKNAFLAFSAWRQNAYTFGLMSSLSERLFTSYLRQPYTFHLQRNSAQLVRNVATEVDLVSTSVVSSVIIIASEALVLVAVIGLVMWVEPVGALAVATLTGVASWVFYGLARSHIGRWGESRQLHAGQRYLQVQQGLGGVKDVKLLGRESDFIGQFREHSEEYARVGGLQNTVLQLPRLWLELLVVAALAALVITMLARGRTVDAVLPALGLFAAAAFRLLPSLNRILSALQALKYGVPAVDLLREELAVEVPKPKAGSDAVLAFDGTIELENVSFRYAAAGRPALRDVQIEVPRGSTVGFIGASGAGKSTLIDILLGLLAPTNGRVLVDGVDIQSNMRGWQDQIGYVPQTIFLTDDSLRRNVAFGLPADAIDDVAVARALRLAQLETFVAELPQGVETVVGERGVRLSGGQRQRIGIARALYHDPAVVVLDEATSSLDPGTEQEVMEAVHALHGRKTIVIVSHRLSTVADCDRLYRLENGRVVDEGEAATVLRTAAAPSRAVPLDSSAHVQR